jgi:hypothetical protein
LPYSIPLHAGTQGVKRNERRCSMRLIGINGDALLEGHNIDVVCLRRI